MPGYQAHLTGGALTAVVGIGGAVFAGTLPQDPPLLAALTAVCLLAALLPDVDTDSKGKRLFAWILLALDAGLLYREEYRWAAVLGVFAILPGLGMHRGWTHRWWAALLFPLPLLAAARFFLHFTWPQALPFYLAALAGYASHLALDREW